MVIVTGKNKVLVVCLAGCDCYYFYHGSDLREFIRFLREIECIEFECNNFFYYIQFVLVQLELKLIQIR